MDGVPQKIHKQTFKLIDNSCFLLNAALYGKVTVVFFSIPHLLIYFESVLYNNSDSNEDNVIAGDQVWYLLDMQFLNVFRLSLIIEP